MRRPPVSPRPRAARSRAPSPCAAPPARSLRQVVSSILLLIFVATNVLTLILNTAVFSS